jgi:hypothetical protein
MKRTLLLLTTAFLLVPAGPGEACPLLYVFQGTVTLNTCLGYDPGRWSLCGSIPGADIPEGTPVAFHVLIDFEAGRHLEDFNTDTFYAEYVSGPSPWANHPSWSNTNGIDTGTWGYWDYPKPWLLGGNSEFWPYQRDIGVFQLYTVGRLGYAGGPRVSDLVVGDHIQGIDVFEEDSGPHISYDDLTLTSISAVSEPVPEPASLLLFGTGLVGLHVWRKGRR